MLMKILFIQKEARMLYEYFDACFKDNVKVDDKYPLDFALFVKNTLKQTGLKQDPFWSKVKLSYETWYKKADPKVMKKMV